MAEQEGPTQGPTPEEVAASTLPDEPTFQVISGDVGSGTVGKVGAPGTIYDIAYDGDVAELEVINKGQDEKGVTSLAVLRIVEGVDGLEQRAELTSNVGHRAVAKGDVLAVKGGKSGKITVTIQRS